MKFNFILIFFILIWISFSQGVLAEASPAESTVFNILNFSSQVDNPQIVDFVKPVIEYNKIIGDNCSHSNECKSDVCFEGKCINLTEMVHAKDTGINDSNIRLNNLERSKNNLSVENYLLNKKITLLENNLNETKSEFGAFKEFFYNQLSNPFFYLFHYSSNPKFSKNFSLLNGSMSS